ncbi:MAG: hypothetical protein P9X24_13210 [Candidatus Hatepunaea meridiana]|nr:hypothetical protein [Candidatus Hatepunaea meridiana]
MDDFGGDWNDYLDMLYKLFEADYIIGRPKFRGKRLNIKRYPLDQDKEATFWHLISEGISEESRNIDLRRCERIRWLRAIVDNADDPNIKVWKNFRKGEKRICLWLEQEDYLVILAERKGYLLPWTAYMITEDHRKRKLQKEYKEWKVRQAQKS